MQCQRSRRSVAYYCWAGNRHINVKIVHSWYLRNIRVPTSVLHWPENEKQNSRFAIHERRTCLLTRRELLRKTVFERNATQYFRDAATELGTAPNIERSVLPKAALGFKDTII